MNSNSKHSHTPMIKQYLLLKEQYPNMLLFYQMGDFYELFFNDAKQISNLLNITLTKRGYINNNVPMAGIPCNNINVYVSKLVKLGKSVVICDQIGNKLLRKGLLERKVVKVITPGTITDEDFLSEHTDNLVASLYEQDNIFGYATLDLASGRFYVSEYYNPELLLSRIQCTNPQELLYPDNFSYMYLISDRKGLNKRSSIDFSACSSKKILKLHFGSEKYKLFEINQDGAALSASGCLLKYVKSMHYNYLHHIRCIKKLNNEDYIYMNVATIKQLDLVENISGNVSNTLYFVLNHTVTRMGSRMLKRWLCMPIRNQLILQNRQKSILELQSHYLELQKLLIRISDLERITSRLSLRTALPRDWLLLRISLRILPKINDLLLKLKSNNLKSLSLLINTYPDLIDLLEKAIAEFPSNSIREGNVIADQYNLQLDQLRTIKSSAHDVLINIEVEEKIKYGINTLKINFNSLIGYYIQISNKYLHLIPKEYIKKQTLKHFTRYTFPSLQQFQETFLTAEFRSVELETILYEELFDLIFPYLEKLQMTSKALSELDVLTNLSERSITLNYVCPILTDKKEIRLKKSRHPVIELLPDVSFVANDINLTQLKTIMVITGPNMGGKSTYMRQIALIVIMSSIGSFVPAKYARIGIIDKIFTRIGSADNVFKKQSTFMLEMVELTSILNFSTENSLVLIDEIGRGTATNDGLSLAWSCLEHLAKNINSMTLFATHYFELTYLSNILSMIKNLFFSVLEQDGKIIFLHTIKPGVSKKSYSLSVAELAGLPNSIISSAKKKLKELDIRLLKNNKSIDIINFISSVEPDKISPREALNYIYLLKNML
ncbi:DNA mismatch repair protein MutS [Buchnera aphidicola (Eriosoma lanigerum)]